jgi:hypothetical protein
MNTLTIEVSEENGLSFELLIDGKPMGMLLEDGNEGIPYWLANDGLPTYPPSGKTASPHVRIVSVCGCGEYGCGHSRCNVTQDNESVVFSDFVGDVGAKGQTFHFQFPLAQYQAVCEQISRLANERIASET